MIPAKASFEETELPKPQQTVVNMKPKDGYCVSFIQAQGFNFKGNAIEWKKHINSYIPIEGAVVVTNESRWGHLALVTKFNPFGTIEVIEQNWQAYNIISTRSINIFDFLI